MVDIYDGSLGVFLDRDMLSTELNKYLVTAQEPLNYEIKERNAKIILITGKNEAEKELTLFQHPFIFRTIRGEAAIALDLRPYMKHNLDDMVNVRDMFSDKYNGMLQLQRLVFTNLMYEDTEIGWLGFSRQSLMEAFGSIISNITSMMLFDRTLLERVDLISKLHLVSMDDDGSDNQLSSYVTRLNRKDITELTHGTQKDLYGMMQLKFNNKEFNLPSRSLGALVANIKATDNGTRTEGLTVDLYAQTLSRGFYSTNSVELSIGMVEHLPTFIAVLINVVTEGINNKSSFRKIVDSNKRTIKGVELCKQLKEIFEEELM